MKLTGECFCGSVKYEIDGGVHSARSCHCSRCRKAFSAQASAYALVDPKTFSWLQGEELLTTYSPDGQFGKRFCRKCGATLCGVVDGEIHGITLGCLNEDKGIQIEAHIFVASKAEWEVLPDGVSRFDAYPPEWLSRT